MNKLFQLLHFFSINFTKLFFYDYSLINFVNNSWQIRDNSCFDKKKQFITMNNWGENGLYIVARLCRLPKQEPWIFSILCIAFIQRNPAISSKVTKSREQNKRNSFLFFLPRRSKFALAKRKVTKSWEKCKIESKEKQIILYLA